MHVVDGEVVGHLWVECCHGHWHVAIRLVPHWSLQSDDGTVVPYFHRNHWRTKTRYTDKQKYFSLTIKTMVDFTFNY